MPHLIVKGHEDIIMSSWNEDINDVTTNEDWQGIYLNAQIQFIITSDYSSLSV